MFIITFIPENISHLKSVKDKVEISIIQFRIWMYSRKLDPYEELMLKYMIEDSSHGY